MKFGFSMFSSAECRENQYFSFSDLLIKFSEREKKPSNILQSQTFLRFLWSGKYYPHALIHGHTYYENLPSLWIPNTDDIKVPRIYHLLLSSACPHVQVLNPQIFLIPRILISILHIWRLSLCYRRSWCTLTVS